MNINAAVMTAPDKLELISTPLPAPAPREVVVDLAAAAINPVDVQTLAGVYHDLGWVSRPGPTGLGWDVAGTIAAVGAEVDEFTVGQQVAGLHAGVDHSLGTLAEKVILPAEAVALVPAGLTPVQASTVPLNALTADQALDLLGPASGRLLVTGAAGGVGGYAVPLAVERGWQVLGWARPGDREFIESTGATALDRAPEESVDAVFDAAVLVDPALDAVRDGGRYVGVTPPAVPAARRGISTTAVMVTADGARLAALLSRAAAGTLLPRVAGTVSFDELAAGFAESGRSGLRGRIVLRP